MEQHTIYLIHPLEVGDAPAGYVDGYNDKGQAVRLSFEVGGGKWQATETSFSVVYSNEDTTISVPKHNLGLVDVYEV